MRLFSCMSILGVVLNSQLVNLVVGNLSLLDIPNLPVTSKDQNESTNGPQ